ISYIGEFSNIAIYPGEVPINEMDYHDIWGNYLRYIGAGAVAFGGLMGLVKTLPTIFSSFIGAVKGFSNRTEEEKLRTDTDIPMWSIVLLTIIFIAVLIFFPHIEVGILGAFLLLIFGFFF